MMENAEQLELSDRLKLIESMMAEGRRTTESWGWNFLLWGVAYYIAAAWATLGHSSLAWPVTMAAAGILTAVVASRMAGSHPGTTLGKAIGAVWAAMGISLFVVLTCLAASGRYDSHVFVAIIGAMLSTANGTSAIILKWKMQFACAAVWLAASVTASFGSEDVVTIAFLAATFFCQIVFGIYSMILDGRRSERRAANA